MTTNPDSQPPAPPPVPLEYANSKSQPSHTGCLVTSLLLATGVGLFVFLAIPFMLTDNHLDFVILVVSCPLLLTVYAIAIRKRGMRVAVAITLISLATFALAFGLCSLVKIRVP